MGIRPMLELQLERIRRADSLGGVIVATTDGREDDEIADLASRLETPVFRGDENDVLDRYYQAARAFDVQVIVRLTADCPLIDPKIIDRVVSSFQQGDGLDFASNALSGGYPDGMDVEVFSFQALARAWEEARLPSEREHVTFHFWKTDLYNILSVEPATETSVPRLTVDYAEDLALVRTIFEQLYPLDPLFSLEMILPVVEALPVVPNASIEPGQGWVSSLRRDTEARD